MYSIILNMAKYITGLFGHPLKHSLSPRMHNAAFQDLGMTDWAYQLFDFPPDQLEAHIQMLRNRSDIKGVNVTVPYKVDVMQYLDEIDPLAKKIGAVNTIKNNKGKLIGYNTDAPGFLDSLTKDAGYSIGTEVKSILILGAGGAARALTHSLKESFTSNISIYDIDKDKSQQLSHETNVNPVVDEVSLPDVASSTSLIINACGIGSSHSLGISPLPADTFNSSQWIYDLGYNPPETEMLRLAKEAGAHTCNGLGMLVRQGALAFEIFTGRKPSVEVMRKAISSPSPNTH